MEDLGISSYGVGVTTLEEVFLKVGKEEEEKDEMIEGQDGRRNS